MPTSFDAMYSETRPLRMLDPEPQAPLSKGLTLLTAVLVLLPIALLFLL